MPAIARFTPFRTASRFETPALFDDLFRNFALSPLWREPGSAPDVCLDVTEDDKAFHVRAEIPGVNKDDIDVSVEGNQVAITAELKQEEKKKDEREIFVERRYGKAYRAFMLPGDVDGERTEARYDKGVLMLTLPKKGNGGAKRIAVG
ncbi:MAG TPA: Hsp20/alpha crystallin family protein [Rhodanobacteraceae bacterium]|nr:Hsp20/alpha crystallin family protein [Rhodanobacteraceae bacterium]